MVSPRRRPTGLHPVVHATPLIRDVEAARPNNRNAGNVGLRNLDDKSWFTAHPEVIDERETRMSPKWSV
jgi:hypothetical protein